jgi:ankyrin repeat protein
MHTLAKNTKYNKLLPKQWSSFYPQKTPTYFRFWDHPTNLEDDMDGIHYHIRLAKLLIERGADLNIKNDKGETPLLTAMDNKHYHLAATLLEAGSKFWIDTDEKGNNFFHHYGYLISRLGYFQPHFSEDVVKQQRWIAIAKKIWDIIESKLTSEMDLKYIVSLLFKTLYVY